MHQHAYLKRYNDSRPTPRFSARSRKPVTGGVPIKMTSEHRSVSNGGNMKYIKASVFCLAVCAMFFHTAAQKGFRAPLMTEADKIYTDNDGKIYNLGLYDGTNAMPEAHRKAGEEIARTIVPLNAKGQPDPNGKIKIAAIGHSVPARIFRSFEETVLAELQQEGIVNPKVELVSCCRGGTTGWEWAETITGVKKECVCTADLQVLITEFTWVGAHGSKRDKTIDEMKDKTLQDLIDIATTAVQCAPNLKMIVLNSDPYMGWASTHEPSHAYEEAFIFRRAIMEQINGNPDFSFKEGSFKIPYLTWGAYLWNPDDPFKLYASDSVHLSPEGGDVNAHRTAQALLENPVTSIWFSNSGHTASVQFLAPKASVQRLTARLNDGVIYLNSTFSNPIDGHLELFNIDGSKIMSVPVTLSGETLAVSLSKHAPASRMVIARVASPQGNESFTLADIGKR